MQKAFIIFLLSVVVGMVLFIEFSYKKQEIYNEKIYDLTLQYQDKIIANKRVVEVLFDDVLNDLEVQSILNDASDGHNLSFNREKLYKMFHLKYNYLKEKGILQFHFHLANGDSFLRFHKVDKYGDNLFFRDSIKQVVETKKKVYGFEVGKYFEGFRYVYPLFYNNNYVGSVECSIGVKSIIEQMEKTLKADFSMILKAENIKDIITKEHLAKYFHKCMIDNNFYMSNKIHDKKLFNPEIAKYLQNNIQSELNNNKSFAKAMHLNGETKIAVFLPLLDIKKNNVGYIFSIRDDSSVHSLFISQLVKFIIAFIVILILVYFYFLNRQKTNLIEQLQEAIDQTTLVSKTDTKGNITYVNEAFVKISGFTKDELIGQPHKIVRDPSTSREVFRDMWKTIFAKKPWKGTITNRTKDGEQYTVDATIIPILNVSNKIVEFVAIRHDISELEKYKEILKDQLEDTSKSLKENINYTAQYEEAINNSTAVLKTDTNNTIIYVNEKFSRLSGYSSKELIGKNCKELRHENHIKMNDCDNIIEKMKQKEIVSLVFTNIAKNGELYFLDTLIYPIVSLENNVIEHLHLMHDISEIINLHQELEDTQKEIIYKMGEIGETRSKETGNHVKRVAEYSKLLALLYGMDEKEAELLKQASPMHDIGKVGIPDSVLKKPGKLDATEWEVMQTHAELGYEMLKHSSRPILKAAATVAGEHHEKYNGKGYPNGLSGEEIHIYGRITAIADVFDALGSDRCYKQAWELEKILELFKEERGEQFDPKLIDLFLENLDKFLEIRESLKD
ncbi:MAG: PAS domain S-box protein [Arcobacteraceae bacterium]|nr:PAS domain S-box protein [Arcobacteraceae bacterium]